jgi:hypothetical protein
MDDATEKQSSLWRLARPLGVLIFLLLMILAGRAWMSYARVQDDLRAFKEFGAAEMLSSPSDGITRMQDVVTRGAQDVRELRGALGPFVYVLPAFGWLPRVGGDLANAPALLEFAESVMTAAQDTVAIGRVLDQALIDGGKTGAPASVSLMQATQLQRALIQRARNNLTQVTQAREKIDATKLSTTSQEILYRLDRWLPLWQIGIDVLANAPNILGASNPRQYLLIAQNSDELRATGGFISGVALVRAEQGQVIIADFQDSFAIDDLSKPHPAAPEPLWRYMYAWQWLFRDANWSPDFPTTARKLEEIYRIDRNVTVDGVIAINQQLLPDLLEAVGPVTVETYNERVDASNVMAKIHAYWAMPQGGPNQSSDWWFHRKDFQGKLLQAVMQKMMTGELDRGQLGRALFDAIECKDLLIYVNELDMLKSSLGGGIYDGAGDLLILVDSNLGFNKVDGHINREVDYSVMREDAGTLRAAVTITYTNLSPDTGAFCVHQPNYQSTYADLQQGCYWDYVRVIVPPASELLRAIGVSDAKKETSDKGYAMLGGYFVLPFGETQVVRFDYRLPSTVVLEPRYQLTWQRQPGAPTIPVRVRLILPEGLEAVSTYPPVRIAGTTTEFALSLERDERIEVRVAKKLPMELIGALATMGAIVLVGIGIILRRRNND